MQTPNMVGKESGTPDQEAAEDLKLVDYEDTLAELTSRLRGTRSHCDA